MFNQWVEGQPWWMTLLLLPAIVLGAVAVKAARYVLLAFLILVVVSAVLVWTWVRQRR